MFVFAGDIKNIFFLYRLLVSVVIGLVCSWVGVPGWDFFTISARIWSSVCNVLFRKCPFTQQISEEAYSLSRLLVSVDIGLVCSWVGVAGWDFPPYLRGLVINLQLVFFQGSSLQEISKTDFFFVKIVSFRRHWSRLLLSWGRGMRFSTISARFGHQFAMFCFDNARLRSRYQKQHIVV